MFNLKFGSFKLKRTNSTSPSVFKFGKLRRTRSWSASHGTKFTTWIPPPENWDPVTGLPYGWESAIDENGDTYYINHIDGNTTRLDPRENPDLWNEPPKPRQVDLERDPQLGFGFVAGSEKPVVVRFVTDGGPSVGKLLPGDQILKINNEDVKKAPREYVINLVRACKQNIVLTVCQPYTENLSGRKSAFISPAKKARLKSQPLGVRFAEAVTINGSPVISPSAHESYIPFMPNVLKVFLENGQTKSFKYDNKTSVKDVLISLQEKLSIKCIEHYALVLQHTKTPGAGKLTPLQEHETLAEVASHPEAQHFKCLFRVLYVPKDAYDLLRRDPIAFEYFYMQCCNDVINERFASELKYDVALRLASLHIQEHAFQNNLSKVTLKNVEKETGLERFIPKSLIANMRPKELRKMLSQYMKMNQNLTTPGQKQLSALQAKLHYMKIVSELKNFGGRTFMATLLDEKAEAMLMVGPKIGISQVTNIKITALSILADFDDIETMTLFKSNDPAQKIEIQLKDQQRQAVSLSMLDNDMHDFIAYVEGYHRVLVDNSKSILKVSVVKNAGGKPQAEIPPYLSKHKVIAASWSYPDDLASQKEDGNRKNMAENERLADFSTGPPSYEEKLEYIDRLKEELGLIESDSLQNTKAVIENEGITNFGVSENNVGSSIESLRDSDSTSSNSTVIHKPNEQTGGYDYDTRTLKRNRTNSAAQLQNLLDDMVAMATSRTKPGLDNKADQSDTESNTSGSISASEFDVKLLSAKDSVMLKHKKGHPSFPDWSMEQENIDEDFTNTTIADVHMDNSVLPMDITNQSADADPMPPPPTEDFASLAHSFGLHSPDQFPPEDPTYHPSMFQDGGLYLDPDLIDLTLIPPPQTPEVTRKIKFENETNIALPPPDSFVFGGEQTTQNASVSHDQNQPMSDDIPVSVIDLPSPIQKRFDGLALNDEALQVQLAAIDALTAGEDNQEKESGIESESDSGNETISDNVDFNGSHDYSQDYRGSHLQHRIEQFNKTSNAGNVEFPSPPPPQIDADFEALIASLTVPPPPGDFADDFSSFPPPPPLDTSDSSIYFNDSTHSSINTQIDLNTSQSNELEVSNIDDLETSNIDDIALDSPTEQSPQPTVRYEYETTLVTDQNTSINDDDISLQSFQALEDEFDLMIPPPPPLVTMTTEPKVAKATDGTLQENVAVVSPYDGVLSNVTEISPPIQTSTSVPSETIVLKNKPATPVEEQKPVFQNFSTFGKRKPKPDDTSQGIQISSNTPSTKPLPRPKCPPPAPPPKKQTSWSADNASQQDAFLSGRPVSFAGFPTGDSESDDGEDGLAAAVMAFNSTTALFDSKPEKTESAQPSMQDSHITNVSNITKSFQTFIQENKPHPGQLRSFKTTRSQSTPNFSKVQENLSKSNSVNSFQAIKENVEKEQEEKKSVSDIAKKFQKQNSESNLPNLFKPVVGDKAGKKGKVPPPPPPRRSSSSLEIKPTLDVTMETKEPEVVMETVQPVLSTLQTDQSPVTGKIKPGIMDAVRRFSSENAQDFHQTSPDKSDNAHAENDLKDWVTDYVMPGMRDADNEDDMQMTDDISAMFSGIGDDNSEDDSDDSYDDDDDVIIPTSAQTNTSKKVYSFSGDNDEDDEEEEEPCDLSQKEDTSSGLVLLNYKQIDSPVDSSLGVAKTSPPKSNLVEVEKVGVKQPSRGSTPEEGPEKRLPVSSIANRFEQKSPTNVPNQNVTVTKPASVSSIAEGFKKISTEQPEKTSIKATVEQMERLENSQSVSSIKSTFEVRNYLKHFNSVNEQEKKQGTGNVATTSLPTVRVKSVAPGKPVSPSETEEEKQSVSSLALSFEKKRDLKIAKPPSVPKVIIPGKENDQKAVKIANEIHHMKVQPDIVIEEKSQPPISLRNRSPSPTVVKDSSVSSILKSFQEKGAEETSPSNKLHRGVTKEQVVSKQHSPPIAKQHSPPVTKQQDKFVNKQDTSPSEDTNVKPSQVVKRWSMGDIPTTPKTHQPQLVKDSAILEEVNVRPSELLRQRDPVPQQPSPQRDSPERNVLKQQYSPGNHDDNELQMNRKSRPNLGRSSTFGGKDKPPVLPRSTSPVKRQGSLKLDTGKVCDSSDGDTSPVKLKTMPFGPRTNLRPVSGVKQPSQEHRGPMKAYHPESPSFDGQSSPTTGPDGSPIRSIMKTPDSNGKGAKRVAFVEADSPPKQNEPSHHNEMNALASISRGDKNGNVCMEIANRTYSGDSTFTHADDDVDTLINVLDRTMEKCVNTNRRKNPDNFPQCKAALVQESRQFVTESKLLVSSATQSKDKLIARVMSSMNSLAKILQHCDETVATLLSDGQAQNLTAKVTEVVKAYRMTLSAAQVAAGKPLSDPNMKSLMRQATSLATILSTLMRTLKVLENIP